MFFIALGVAVIMLLYLYGTRNFKYWEKRGVKYIKPVPFLGTTTRQFFQKISPADYATEVYRQYPGERFIGAYLANKPMLVLRDPELVKHFLQTDFQYFYRRGLKLHDTVVEPMMRNIFHADGDSWKLLRQRLTPAFTSGKLKAMFPLIIEKAKKLQLLAAEAAETGKEVDVRDLIARYTTDFIGAVGFGIESDSLKDENSKFRQLGRRIFNKTKRDGLVIFLKTMAPNFFKHLRVLAPEIENGTLTLVKTIMEQRNYKPAGRNDFIDLLLELKQKGTIVGESIEKRNADGSPVMTELEMDDILMAAQVFVFFAAGFETSSSTSSYTLHLLAFHPEEQKRCQEEIDEVLSRHGGRLSYDAVKEMKYLEMCFKESMRILPALSVLNRRCAKKYTIPTTNITIDEQVLVMVPIHALQNDEKYFEEPEKFKPERFHPDNAKDFPKHVYLPFGEGPRACIGERLGFMQSTAGLAAVLSQFSVAPSKSTLRHPIIDPKSNVVQVIQGGLPLALVARQKNTKTTVTYV